MTRRRVPSRGGGIDAVVPRRTVLRVLGAAGLLAALPACSAPFADVPLTIATGGGKGVYYSLGTALAEAWREGLGLTTVPTVLPTGGSVENVTRLAAGTADVAFSQVDVAKESIATDPQALRALARVYDEFVHIVVPSSSPVTTLAQLGGARVSVGARNSGVYFTVRRLLTAIGLSPDRDLRAAYLSVDASTAALQRGEIDAFFWIGALPTPSVTALASSFPIRLLDLELGDVAGQVRATYREYAEGTVPAGTYSITTPVTTLLVRNFLLAGAGMADDLAYSLVDGMFRYQPQLARATEAALTIDLRAAIGTQPVPLHPGAERYFRAAKNA
jgi:uncharacterized protein